MVNKALLFVGGTGLFGGVYAIKKYLESHAVFDLVVGTFIALSLVGLLIFFVYVRGQNNE